jgi:hypothetical protein
MPANEALRRWIEDGLKKSAKTQRGLARALNIDPACVTRIRQGTRRVALHEIEPAARYLGVSPPPAYQTRDCAVAVHRYIDLSPDLRDEVFQRAMDLGIEPEEFLARAVRGAIGLLGPRRGKDMR